MIMGSRKIVAGRRDMNQIESGLMDLAPGIPHLGQLVESEHKFPPAVDNQSSARQDFDAPRCRQSERSSQRRKKRTARNHSAITFSAISISCARYFIHRIKSGA